AMPAVRIPAPVAIDPPNSPAPAVGTTDTKATKPTATVTTLSPNASIPPDTAVLRQARDALTHANLTSPADSNAVDLTGMAWKLSPATADTRVLATDVLKAISVQQVLAIGQHHDQRALDYQQKAQQLADATIGRSTPAWRKLHSDATGAIQTRVQLESDASDAAALKRTKALAKQLDLSSVYAKALAAAQQKALAAAQEQALAAAKLKASMAPPKPSPTGMAAGFVAVPHTSDQTGDAALARAEVTRGEYAQFVNATHRAASACSDRRAGDESASKSAAAGKSWSDPGFDQTGEQPVVCVSWNDANAYAQWLSAKSGQRYRLAGTADWRAMTTKGAAAAEERVAGSVTEWLQNCSFLCIRHLVAGRTWREHGTDAPAALASNRGFDDVGFRVVRVQDAPH
ncbi:MAG TPA: SUMF1/EgtB/PvdO family nonheme iron enzyme, partial [Xanthomonadaceae bacterium]|nr:SUMF1/EgtB/PvdO family nonheme iron enzyme [Xanthomonadaceae bacterium]